MMLSSLVGALAMLSLCSAVLATEYFVDSSEASNGSGTTASPFNNLQAAFDALSITGGDIITLSPTTEGYSVASAVALGAWDGSLTIRSPAAGAAALVSVPDDSGFLSFTNSDSAKQLELLIENVDFSFAGMHHVAPFSIKSAASAPGSIITFDTVTFDFEDVTGVDYGHTIVASAANFTLTNVVVNAFRGDDELQFARVEGGAVELFSVSFTNGVDTADGSLFGLEDITSLVVDNVSFPSVASTSTFPSNHMGGFLTVSTGGLAAGAILDSQIDNVVFNDIHNEDSGMIYFIDVVADSSLRFNNVTASNPHESYPITLIDVESSYSYYDASSSTTVNSIIGQVEMSGLMITAPGDTTASGTFFTGYEFFADVVTISDCSYTGPVKSNSALFSFTGTISSRLDLRDVTINALPYFIDTTRRKSKTISTNVVYMGENVTAPTINNLSVSGFEGSYVIRSSSELTVTNSSLIDSTPSGFITTQTETHVVDLNVVNTTLSSSLFMAGDGELSLSGVSIDEDCELSTGEGGLIFCEEDVSVTTLDPIIISQELLPLTGPLFHVNLGTIDGELEITGCGDLSRVLPLIADISSFDESSRRYDNRISVNITDSRAASCDPVVVDDDDDDDDDDVDGSVSSAASGTSHVLVAALFMAALLY